MASVTKMLKLRGGEWYYVNGSEKVRLSGKDILTFVRFATYIVRKGFIKIVGDLVEFEDEKRKAKLKKGQITSAIYKEVLTGTGDLTVSLENGKEIKLQKDSIPTAVQYSLQENIKRNLREGKTIAIKGIPLVRQANMGVLKGIEFIPNGKKIKVRIELAMFKGASLVWEGNLSAKKSAKENSYYQILRRIQEGEYELKFAGFGYKERGRDTGAYLVLCYSVPVQEMEIEKNKVMGIDLGQECLAYFAISDSYARGDLTRDSEFVPEWLRSEKFDWKRKIYAVWTKKKALQRELRHTNNLLKEVDDENLKKRKRRVVKELDSLRHYEANFMDTLNKTVASVVKKIAEKEKVSKVVMEDISVDVEKKNSLMFPKWNYSQLQTYIENKMQEIGVEVVKVNPACTSLRCPECGYIGFLKDVVRPRRDRFVCPACGYEAHADYVGARNLTVEGIEKVIHSKLKADIKALGGDPKDIPSEKNHYLQNMRRSLIRKKLNEYLGLPEKTSLKKSLAVLRKRDYNVYERFVKNPVEFFKEAQKPPRLLDN